MAVEVQPCVSGMDCMAAFGPDVGKPTDSRARIILRTGRSDSAGSRGVQPDRRHYRRGGDVPSRVVYLLQVQPDGLREVG